MQKQLPPYLEHLAEQIAQIVAQGILPRRRRYPVCNNCEGLHKPLAEFAVDRIKVVTEKIEDAIASGAVDRARDILGQFKIGRIASPQSRGNLHEMKPKAQAPQEIDERPPAKEDAAKTDDGAAKAEAPVMSEADKKIAELSEQIAKLHGDANERHRRLYSQLGGTPFSRSLRVLADQLSAHLGVAPEELVTEVAAAAEGDAVADVEAAVLLKSLKSRRSTRNPALE